MGFIIPKRLDIIAWSKQIFFCMQDNNKEVKMYRWFCWPMKKCLAALEAYITESVSCFLDRGILDWLEKTVAASFKIRTKCNYAYSFNDSNSWYISVG